MLYTVRCAGYACSMFQELICEQHIHIHTHAITCQWWLWIHINISIILRLIGKNAESQDTLIPKANSSCWTAKRPPQMATALLATFQGSRNQLVTHPRSMVPWQNFKRIPYCEVLSVRLISKKIISNVLLDVHSPYLPCFVLWLLRKLHSHTFWGSFHDVKSLTSYPHVSSFFHGNRVLLALCRMLPLNSLFLASPISRLSTGELATPRTQKEERNHSLLSLLSLIVLCNS